MSTSIPTEATAGLEPRPVIVVVPRQSVHWVIAGLLGVIATLLLLRGGDGLFGAPAVAQTGMLGARGLFAFTGQLETNRFGLWMLDVDAATVWCYEYNPTRNKMRLVAARSYRWDRYLENYNQDESTTPEKIQKALEAERQYKLNLQALNQNLSGAAPATSQPNSTAVPAVSGS